MLAALSVGIACAAATAHAQLDPDVERTIRERIGVGEYVGVSVAVIDADSVAYYNFGTVDRGSARAPTEDSLYEIGSITKTFTALALAQRVVDAEVELGDPVQDALDELPSLSRDDVPVTFLQLANHHSGLPRLPANLDATNLEDPYANYTWEDLLAFLATYELQRAPGEAFEYSNLGVGLLGEVLARMHGQSYRTFIRDAVLDPLQMRATDVDVASAYVNRAVSGHGPTGEVVPAWDVSVLGGAGDLVSSAREMVQYLRAQMGQVSTPLDAAIELSHRPTGARVMGADPAGGNGARSIALAWLINERPVGNILWHNGGTGGFRSYAGFVEGGARGAIVLGNTMRSVDDIGMRLLDPQAELEAVRAEVPLSATELAGYAGQYEFAPGVVFAVTQQDGRLSGRLNGQPALLYYSGGGDEFFSRVLDVQLLFERGADGAIDALNLRQSGVDQLAIRLDEDGAPLRRPGNQIEVSLQELTRLEGRYRGVADPSVVFAVAVDAEGFLTVQLMDQPSLRVYAQGPNDFSYSVVNARILFVQDPESGIARLTLFQGGRVLEAVRED